MKTNGLVSLYEGMPKLLIMDCKGPPHDGTRTRLGGFAPSSEWSGLSSFEASLAWFSLTTMCASASSTWTDARPPQALDAPSVNCWTRSSGTQAWNMYV